MEFFVPLLRLPDGLAFPERLRERVAYDPEKQRLTYRGFMTKCTYDELSALSGDPAYRRALEQLFVQTSAAADTQPARRRPLAMALGVIAALALTIATLWLARSGPPSQSSSPQTAAVTRTSAE